MTDIFAYIIIFLILSPIIIIVLGGVAMLVAGVYLLLVAVVTAGLDNEK